MQDPLNTQAQSKLVPEVSKRVTWFGFLMRLLMGKPISSDHAEHTLLNRVLALPVFASDAISSVAYATQEIILFLGAAVYAGKPLYSQTSPYTFYTLLLTGLVVLLLTIVVISYWQTIHGYPNGGGSYIVSKDNLGKFPGLIAAAALLIDYILTVAVSIASGVQNLGGLPGIFQMFHFNLLVPWCILFTLLLTAANLRGLKESGSLFAIFTYGFVVMCYVMILLGIFGPLFHLHIHPQYVNHNYGPKQAAETFGLVVLLRAFANGCSAMTGTEAVSNGIPAFKEPKSHNAAITLIYMGIILGSIFLGISWLAMHLKVVYWEANGQTADAVIDQISGAIFGKTGALSVGYYLTQFLTAAVLVLAANTSFADFPRLSSILAKDGFMPKQMSNLGDKLVFTNGILILGVSAIILIIYKHGNVDALIPFYAIGVFTAFTLSQSGMVVHWKRCKVKGWRIKALINGIGACATGLVLMDIAVEKFMEGAYVVIILVIMMVFVFTLIQRHYLEVAAQLRLKDYIPPDKPYKNTVLVLVPHLHRGVMPALEYARSLSSDCRGLHICINTEEEPRLKERWEVFAHDVPLIIIHSPYRTLVEPIMRYLDAVRLERDAHTITVVIPEFVPSKKWHFFLHGQSAARLKLALLSRKDVVVTNVRYYLHNMQELQVDDALMEEISPQALPSHSHEVTHDH